MSKSKNRPKRHHYVPQFLLREFTDDNKKLHFCILGSSEGAVIKPSERVVKSATPKNLFLKKELYTQYSDHGEKDSSLEESIRNLETEAAPVIKKIINSARANKLLELNPDERDIWDAFFLIQSLRIPDILDPIVNEYPDWIPEFISDYEKEHGPPTKEEIKKANDPKEIERTKQNLRAITVSRLTSESKIFQILQGRGLIIGVIRKPNKSFIIGSNPTARLYRQLSDPEAEWHLPIAHDITVTHHGFYDRGEENLAKITGDHTIRKINETICNWSSSIAGRSRRLITSLARVKKSEP